jgi:asparagine synthase (glutamine-hydrolysing)
MAYVVRPLAPDYVRHIWRIARRRNGPPWGFGTILNPDFAGRIGLAERFEMLRCGRTMTPRTSKQDHFLRLTWGFHQFILEVLDRTAASHSVEGRHVGYDIRIAEFCLALPGQQKLRDGWNRVVMRRAMADALPEPVRSRGGKCDVSAPWIRSLLDCDEPIEEAVATVAEVVGIYVDVDAFRNAYRRYLAEGTQYDAIKVWWAMVLITWLRGSGIAAIDQDAA